MYPLQLETLDLLIHDFYGTFICQGLIPCLQLARSTFYHQSPSHPVVELCFEAPTQAPWISTFHQHY